MNRFLVKLLLNGIVVVPFLLVFTEASFLEAALAAVALSVIAYVLGDQLILRRTNNTVATIADLGLAYLFFWLVADYMNWSLSATELATLVLGVGVVEVFYHMYLNASDRRTADE
ncbi:DUF2512 family protein [Paenibacillus flagellatus]|uniref:DUF2512 domain-containing protein n=1 Tax=Paenibacillus flagellatus TaxID=2211139 RepID=A0A2V5KS96_9BACL|nr:DUF2512 family protein [Paenibacillus flagellatus]PYI51866.1 hypothetical protein DLM86_23410 [Paenibacillus flagellatus]